MIPANNS